MQRELGKTGRKLKPIGLGCMGLSEFYGAPTEENAAIKLLQEAIERGVDHFDTAEMYGPHTNETLLGKAFKGRRDQVFIATKFGPLRDGGATMSIDASAANCRRAIEDSLQRLQTEAVDLYYLHRMDPQVPIEDTVGAMADLVAEGKIKAIGLSEASGETIRRAAKVHPITAVQSEYSIFSRDIEESVMPAIREVGASLVAYSPLGRGMLAGAFTADNRPGENDFRGIAQPRYQGDAYADNLALADKISKIAETHGCSPSQVSLAWVLAQGRHIHTIPGTTKLKNLKANLGAYDVTLTADDMAALGALADQVMGERYTERGMASLDR